MKQCKLCGSPLGKDLTTEELDKHWKKHHNWHLGIKQRKVTRRSIAKKTRLIDVLE